VVFRHSSPEYPGDHRGPPPCTACHTSNADAATWTFPQYRPYCAGCHANSFKADPHKKWGDVKYTVSELRDCSGACHYYTNSTLTTILERRPGPQHRPSDSSFNR
jgi:hypothetical protein